VQLLIHVRVGVLNPPRQSLVGQVSTTVAKMILKETIQPFHGIMGRSPSRISDDRRFDQFGRQAREIRMISSCRILNQRFLVHSIVDRNANVILVALGWFP
jgi:hypothetical protein